VEESRFAAKRPQDARRFIGRNAAYERSHSEP
jgi:hypothetical protein